MPEKSLSEQFEEYYSEKNKQFRNWKARELIKDKQKYFSVVDDELDDLLRDWLIDYPGSSSEHERFYWLTHYWPSFEESPYNIILKGHSQIVKDYIDSKFRGIPE